MDKLFQYGFWDVALIAAVVAQATIIAYLYQPKWKAFALSLPIPFSLASMALAEQGIRVDASNALGMLLLIAFAHAVRVLHYNLRVPIVPSIVAAAVGFCAAGAALAPLVPRSDRAFWISVALLAAIALAAERLTPHRDEPGHRTPLPVWIKLPILAAVILVLVSVKPLLRGFMTAFPMVGVTTLYEGRHCLWTICKQMPVIALILTALIVSCRLLQDRIGLSGALGVGWVFVLSALVLHTRFRWARLPIQDALEEK